MADNANTLADRTLVVSGASRGIGLAIGIGRLAVVATQPLIGSLVDRMWVCTILLVIALVYALVLIPVFRMPETANKQLEDIVS